MRVLIPTVTAGAGHLQAAIALEEAWRVLRPADEVRRVDVLDFTPKWYRKLYVDGYVKLIKHAPELYAMVFKKTDNPACIKELTRFRRRTVRLIAAKFVKNLVEFQPDVLMSPHYLPLEILGGVLSRRRNKVHPFTACVITDFEAHALWMEPCVEVYCVATEETKARLVARGAHENSVLVTGIPIAGKFSLPVDVVAIRKEFGLCREVPTLLVLSGGFGMGPVTEILGEIEKIEREVQVLVVCGRNEPLRKKVEALPKRNPTRVLGFATNMHELMAVSDLILTKPGGLTTSEALAIGKPLLILNPIPGQEAANSDFLLEHGAAVKVNCVEDLPFKLGQLLGSQKLSQMTRAARALGKPGAARAICEGVLERVPRALPAIIAAASTLKPPGALPSRRRDTTQYRRAGLAE